MNKEYILHKINHNKERYLSTLKWAFISLLTGGSLGVIGAVFHHGIAKATQFRLTHPEVLFLLPVGSIVILLLYHLLHNDNDGGTNLVLSSIQSDREVPLKMAPLIFVSTILSHLIGASVGREGAALQLGGSVGSFLGRVFHFNEQDKKTMIMVGMSGVFSALFGTPIAASIFPLEVVSVGIMHYAALVPCVISSLVARGIAEKLGAPAAHIDIGTLPAFTIEGSLHAVFLASLCGFLSIVFCFCLRKGEFLSKHFLKNKYLRAILLGSTILLMTFLVGNQTYNGAGMDHITDYVAGKEPVPGFLIKILFTVVSICAGYKGGEIVPSFFIGASFGCIYGNLTGFSPALCTAIGMGSVFCGVTNSPVSSLLICFELFGFTASPFFLLACAFSYMISGYYSLYTSQRIVYSKFKSNYINKDAQ